MIRAFEEIALEHIKLVKEQAIANLHTRQVPAERIIVPSATIVGPAVQAMVFAADDPELRDMFASLLATAMDSATAHKAHPAFVEVLRQITPDEARIIRLFLTTQKFPIWHLEADNFKTGENGAGFIETTMKMEYMSLIGSDAGCEHLELTPSYINNLCRLGFAYLTSRQLPFNIRNEAALNSPNLEHLRLGELIEKTPQVSEVLKEVISLNPERNRLRFWTRYMTVMPFGLQFCAACVMPPEFSAQIQPHRS